MQCPGDGGDNNSINNLMQRFLRSKYVKLCIMHLEFYLAHRKYYVSNCSFKTHVCTCAHTHTYAHSKDVISELKPSNVKTETCHSHFCIILFSALTWPNSFLDPLILKLFFQLLCVTFNQHKIPLPTFYVLQGLEAFYSQNTCSNRTQSACCTCKIEKEKEAWEPGEKSLSREKWTGAEGPGIKALTS